MIAKNERLNMDRLNLKLTFSTGWPLVREKSGKFDFSSEKSQGILQITQGNFKYQESQGIS